MIHGLSDQGVPCLPDAGRHVFEVCGWTKWWRSRQLFLRASTNWWLLDTM